jgi:hypothetical protein
VKPPTEDVVRLAGMVITELSEADVPRGTAVSCLVLAAIIIARGGSTVDADMAFVEETIQWIEAKPLSDKVH